MPCILDCPAHTKKLKQKEVELPRFRVSTTSGISFPPDLHTLALTTSCLTFFCPINLHYFETFFTNSSPNFEWAKAESPRLKFSLGKQANEQMFPQVFLGVPSCNSCKNMFSSCFCCVAFLMAKNNSSAKIVLFWVWGVQGGIHFNDTLLLSCGWLVSRCLFHPRFC